jgi:hypothetical protein
MIGLCVFTQRLHGVPVHSCVFCWSWGNIDFVCVRAGDGQRSGLTACAACAHGVGAIQDTTGAGECRSPCLRGGGYDGSVCPQRECMFMHAVCLGVGGLGRGAVLLHLRMVWEPSRTLQQLVSDGRVGGEETVRVYLCKHSAYR